MPQLRLGGDLISSDGWSFDGLRGETRQGRAEPAGSHRPDLEELQTLHFFVSSVVHLFQVSDKKCLKMRCMIILKKINF